MDTKTNYIKENPLYVRNFSDPSIKQSASFFPEKHLFGKKNCDIYFSEILGSFARKQFLLFILSISELHNMQTFLVTQLCAMLLVLFLRCGNGA